MSDSKLERVTPETMRRDAEAYEAKHGKRVVCSRCHQLAFVKNTFCSNCGLEIPEFFNKYNKEKEKEKENVQKTNSGTERQEKD